MIFILFFTICLIFSLRIMPRHNGMLKGFRRRRIGFRCISITVMNPSLADYKTDTVNLTDDSGLWLKN